MNDSPNYWAGRAARADGKPRQLIDGRYSLAGRKEWLAGWDDEDRFRAAPLTDQQREQQRAGWAALKEGLR